jgi:hypothetical protein
LVTNLEAAWAAAEKYLPPDWAIADLSYLLPHDEVPPYWAAEANRIERGKWYGESIEGQGDTPADALFDLAQLLKKR